MREVKKEGEGDERLKEIKNVIIFAEQKEDIMKLIAWCLERIQAFLFNCKYRKGDKKRGEGKKD